MLRCTMCDTPIENIELPSCPECNSDPITGELVRDGRKSRSSFGAVKHESFLPFHILARIMRDQDMGVSKDDMDLVAARERSIERRNSALTA